MLIIDQSVSTYLYKELSFTAKPGETKRTARLALRSMKAENYFEVLDIWQHLLPDDKS